MLSSLCGDGDDHHPIALIAVWFVADHQHHQEEGDQYEVAYHRENAAGRVNEDHTTSEPEGRQ